MGKLIATWEVLGQAKESSEVTRERSGHVMSTNKNQKLLTFKGRPLVRSGSIIFYGSITDKYVIMMQILSEENYKDMKIAKKISVQLQVNEPGKDLVEKQTEKTGMYAAMDIADIWLERALAEADSI